MAKFELNANGTVNLDSAERALAAAEKACTEAFKEARRAETEVNRIPSYLIAHGRAMARLDAARSNAEGALEHVKECMGAVHEALNPEHA